ncbi:hypothetical protein BCR32DRAFT_302308 [Anaeromyces robustus]|uniref:Uncharacterized protein n=1 Tax=Anaeromyces robustus TaxID=1754192 RepID=A0A1Y1WW32_9FUNG|nr:hypothetical protein BCR32DRAFT_302308 [Anaeromyces robustus]|eukprot:ORX77757.1 hypothetical protein BCR32DRAFT_302308 [Anaeromyces robustus]
MNIIMIYYIKRAWIISIPEYILPFDRYLVQRCAQDSTSNKLDSYNINKELNQYPNTNINNIQNNNNNYDTFLNTSNKTLENYSTIKNEFQLIDEDKSKSSNINTNQNENIPNTTNPIYLLLEAFKTVDK